MGTVNPDENFIATEEDVHSIEQFLKIIRPRHDALMRHSVYSHVSDVLSLRVFMESHVFAVWDFMALLKTLQRRLTCVDVLWLPPKDTHSARLVNEIVLAEETDEVEAGNYFSHFDLYLAAMEEVGANTRPVSSFIDALTGWIMPELAMMPLPISQPTRDFVNSTLEIAGKSNHEVAAAFLFGREEITGPMFRRILRKLEGYRGQPCPSFRLYLERHIHLDETEHVPMGRKLLRNLCGDDPQKWSESLATALEALEARRRFWDGVVLSISELKQRTE